MTDKPKQTEFFEKSKDLPIHLPVFEGPLDLLLFLIKRNEIDIYDIPILSVTEQYLEALYSMETLQIEIAGEFFVMAASLMQIKSNMLLPIEKQDQQIDESADENIDPRWELVQQLLDYKKYKDAAEELEKLSEIASRQLPRINSEETEIIPLENSDKISIWNAFNKVLRQLSERMHVGQIDDESVSTADRMEFLLQELQNKELITFSSLFTKETDNLACLISTFLAILELNRLGKIEIRQRNNFDEIILIGN